METFSVVVGIYGDLDVWGPRAEAALASVEGQGALDARISHADTLAQARNRGAIQAGGDYLIFLDADDLLAPDYVGEMSLGIADLRQPATLGMYPDGTFDPYPVNIPPRQSIRQGNWFVIGTAIPTEMFWRAGGFGEEPAWEDWSLMLRCFALGATWEPRPGAIYKVGVSIGGRNNQATDNLNLFEDILAANDRWAEVEGLIVR